MKTSLTIISLIAALLPAGCAWLGSDRPEQLLVTPAAGTTISDRQLDFADGPALDYRLYLPAGYSINHSRAPSSGALVFFDSQTGSQPGADAKAKPLVILAHGFLRDQRRMQGLATALANAGYPVATLNFRHGSPISGGHVNNSQDMVALGRHLQADRVIHAGFSAGGLAALLAARQDKNTIGLLTLDLVDSRELGRTAADGLELPVVALAGAPTNCNAYDNASPAYDLIRHLSLTRIPQASHCDFESPSDWLCRSICNQPSNLTGEPAAGLVESHIIQAAVAGISQMADG